MKAAVVHIPGQPPRYESFTLRKRHLESHPRVLPPGLGPTAVRLGPAFLLLGLANPFSEVAFTLALVLVIASPPRSSR